MLRQQKEAVIAEVTRLLEENANLVVSDYRGLTVADMTELRAKLREGGARFMVVKNTLGAVAAERAGRPLLKELFTGPTAVTFCGDDPVGAAKVLVAFARSHPQLDIRGALLEDSLVDAAAVRALATLPSRDVLVAQVLGTMVAPITGLVTVLHGTIAGLVRALDQVARQRAAEA